MFEGVGLGWVGGGGWGVGTGGGGGGERALGEGFVIRVVLGLGEGAGDRLLYDLQDTLDKLMHFLPQLSDLVLLKNGFYSFRAHTD